MKDTSIIFAFYAETVFWILVIVGIFVAQRWWAWARVFSGTMIRQWRPSLVITIIYVVSMGLTGQGILNLSGAVVFCQAIVGLALARSIVGFEPLPVTQAVIRREGAWRHIGIMIGIALLLIPLPIIVSMLGGFGGHLFGEVALTGNSVSGAVPSNKWQIFLVMLAGAGISEETPYRLVLLSLLWLLTRRRWLAIVLSAVIFGIYHLTPLNLMYGIYWQAPITQLLTSTLGGLVMGYVYTKRGYETVVLGHTLGNWVLFSLFTAV
jgi:membrane protease YdiL (CAAX protease family)